MKQQMRALSHDMSANFMVLEHSFQLLKEHVQDQHVPNLSEGANHLEACLQESRRLLSDLRSLAKTGSVPVATERVALSATIQQVVYEQEDVLGERRIRVVVEPELPVVWCNEQRARQMITNLVRNAALHGCDPENGRVLISGRPADKPGGLATLIIHDNGPGIPKEVHDDIFQPGVRQDDTSAGGSGQGLAIVRQTVEHYGGRVFVDPTIGRGTSFVVKLPDASGPDASGQ
tara:strand:+ start:817 stop:1512 length:696 start_codon:yes stop_codon:yes gene_type:complete